MKKMALVGYPPRYFLPFGHAMEAAGFAVHWIVGLHSEAVRLRQHGISADRILDTASVVLPMPDLEERTAILASLEQSEGPRVRDVILMDRMLRRYDDGFAFGYLAGVARAVTEFLERRDITLVSSGRDTALQMLVMLICRRDGRGWFVPTRTRLPRDRFGFMTSHECNRFVPLREVNAEDVAAARRYLTDFRTRGLAAAARSSARGVTDVLRRFPMHVQLLGRAVGDAIYDRGNAYSRYTVLDLVRMWLRRRRNMLGLKILRPYHRPGARPYFLYALHTQPESSIDVAGSFFADQIALVRQIARATPATHDLYIKAHPSDIDGKPVSFYREIRTIPGVRLIEPLVDSRELLRRASVVFTVTGTIAYEAGLLGIPAVTFAPLYFNSLPSTHYCESPRQLPALVDSVLTAGARETDDAAIVDFLARLFAYSLPGEFNRVDAPLTDEDLSSLRTAYDRLLALRERATIEPRTVVDLQ